MPSAPLLALLASQLAGAGGAYDLLGPGSGSGSGARARAGWKNITVYRITPIEDKGVTNVRARRRPPPAPALLRSLRSLRAVNPSLGVSQPPNTYRAPNRPRSLRSRSLSPPLTRSSARLADEHR